MTRFIRNAVAVAVVAALLGGVGVGAATAADIGAVQSPRPSAQHVWAVKWTDLPKYTYANMPAKNTYPKFGGWNAGPARATSYYTNLASDKIVRPQSLTLGEPFITTSTSPASIAVPVYGKVLVDNRNWVSAMAQWGDTDPQTTNRNNSVGGVTCADTEWSLSDTWRRYSGGSTGSLYGNDRQPVGIGAYATSSNCPYIVSMGIFLDIQSPAGTHKSYFWQWYAQFAAEKRPYKSESEMTLELCNGPQKYEVAADCVYLDGARDDFDYDKVCANAPAVQWLSFDWIPAVIGHYSRCLFMAPAGMDRAGTLAAAWEAGPASKIVAPIEAAGSSLEISESCGVLVPGGTGMLGGMSVNTCYWNTWAGPLKLLIGVGATLYFAWWLIPFLIACAMSVINRKIPSPLGAGGDDE